MDRAYHYTSKANLSKILETGMLLPMSDPYSGEYFASQTAKNIAPENIRSIICSEKYICGMPDFKHEGWIEYGLMKRLMKWTKREILLEIPLIFSEGVFVRELKWVSPKYLCDVDKKLWDSYKAGRIMPSQFVRRKYHRMYINSTTPLNDYKNNFEVPEIWIPAEISMDLVKIIKLK